MKVVVLSFISLKFLICKASNYPHILFREVCNDSLFFNLYHST